MDVALNSGLGNTPAEGSTGWSHGHVAGCFEEFAGDGRCRSTLVPAGLPDDKAPERLALGPAEFHAVTSMTLAPMTSTTVRQTRGMR